MPDQAPVRNALRVLLVLSAATGLRGQPIRAHPDNPHYYLFRGRPTVLITSAEHYGAVMNRAFDCRAYLDTLKSYGLNYTRIYPAAFVEPEGTFLPGNTLAPKSADLIQPWARSQTPGYPSGGNRFDLDRWDHALGCRVDCLSDVDDLAGDGPAARIRRARTTPSPLPSPTHRQTHDCHCRDRPCGRSTEPGSGVRLPGRHLRALAARTASRRIV